MKNVSFTLFAILIVVFAVGQTSPIAYYPFNGNALDMSGNGYHGTLIGNACITEDNLEIPHDNSSALSLPFEVINGLEDFTFTAFMKINSIHSLHTWISGARTDLANSFIFGYESYFDAWVIYFENVEYNFPVNNTIEDMGWHHIAVTRQGSVSHVFIDGDKIGPGITVSNDPISIGLGGLIIGQEQDVLGGNFSIEDSWAGNIDDFRVYQSALTEDEIKEISLNAHLVAYFPFNGNAIDETGNGNDGQVNGAVLAPDRFCNPNSAYYFDGIDDHIRTPVNNFMDQLNEGSISVWVKRTSNNLSSNVIMAYTNDSWGGSVYSFNNNGDSPSNHALANWYKYQGNTPNMLANTPLIYNEWYHIVYVADGISQVKVYLNGVHETTIFNNNGSSADGSEWFADVNQVGSYDHFLVIGMLTRDGGSIEGPFEGFIDDIIIFDVPLSEDEILEIYNNESLPDIAVELGDDITACEGEQLVLDAGNPGMSYLWSTGETTQTIEVTTSGTYSVEVSDGCATAYDEINITFNPLPIVDAGDTATIYIGYTPTQTELNASGGVEYLWSPSDGLSDPTIPNPIAQSSTSTLYTVYVTDANGCTNTDSVFVLVIDAVCGNNLNKVLMCHIMPNGNEKTICVSPNAVPALLAQGSYVGPCYKGSEIIEASELGEGNTESISIRAYPNPFLSSCAIEVTLEKTSNLSLVVQDLNGRTINTVFEGNLSAGEHTFTWNTNHFENQSSVYFMRAITDFGTKTIKLIKK